MAQVKFLPSGVEVEVAPGESLYHAAHVAGIAIASVCGGLGSCTGCRVKVLEGAEHLSPMGYKEKERLGNTFFITKERLACQTTTSGPLVVEVLQEQQRDKRDRARKRALDRTLENAQRRAQRHDGGGPRRDEGPDGAGRESSWSEAGRAERPSPGLGVSEDPLAAVLGSLDSIDLREPVGADVSWPELTDDEPDPFDGAEPAGELEAAGVDPGAPATEDGGRGRRRRHRGRRGGGREESAPGNAPTGGGTGEPGRSGRPPQANYAGPSGPSRGTEGGPAPGRADGVEQPAAGDPNRRRRRRHRGGGGRGPGEA